MSHERVPVTTHRVLLPTHLSWHPGPDPKKHPMGWAPLCGARVLPWAITPHVSDVDCADCMKILWSGRFDGVVSDRTAPR